MTDATPSLLQHLPGLRASHLALGQYPTPVQHLPGLGDLWIKREDLSSPVYGGNKVRTLEFLLAAQRERGHTKVLALGAYGSNHAVAAILHGARAGFETGAMLFPQPATPVAAENLRVSISYGAPVILLRTILTFPLRAWLRHIRGTCYVMPPGGAVPLGAFGHISAALELAQQVKAGELPAPTHIVVAVGSTCTTAGLVAGLAVAKHWGLWIGDLPVVHGVPVTPWPVTAKFRILSLARRTLHELEHRGGPAVDDRLLPALLQVRRGHLGRGYGRPTREGLAAAEAFAAHGGPPLDTTYAGKSGAGLLVLQKLLKGPVLFWSTKSSVPLPPEVPQRLQQAPEFIQVWLRRGAHRATLCV